MADRKYDHKLIPNVKCGKFGIGRVVTLDEFGRVQQCTICFRGFAFCLAVFVYQLASRVGAVVLPVWCTSKVSDR